MVREQLHPTHSAGCHRAAAFGRALRRPLRRVAVVGDSMLPSFAPGDRLLVAAALMVRPGDVVALEDPRRSGFLMIKRVRAAGPDWVDVRGDNPAASTDSRHFGPVPRSVLRGRVIYRYGPPGRAGWRPDRPV